MATIAGPLGLLVRLAARRVRRRVSAVAGFDLDPKPVDEGPRQKGMHAKARKHAGTQARKHAHRHASMHTRALWTLWTRIRLQPLLQSRQTSFNLDWERPRSLRSRSLE